MAKKVIKIDLLLDTSLQIERVKSKEINNLIIDESTRNNLTTSHFVLYEFKVGFIVALIDFYSLVQLKDNTDDALAKWSDHFSGRHHKYKDILDAVIVRLCGNIKTSSKNDYLVQIEAAISRILGMFEWDLKGYVGNFSNDEIVKYPINSSKDYLGFMDLYNGRKCIPLIDFYNSNIESVDKILKVDSSLLKPKDIRDHFISLQLLLSDLSKVDDSSVNKKLGDTTIAIDQPKSYSLITLDNIFNILCDTLGKKHYLVKKTSPGVAPTENLLRETI